MFIYNMKLNSSIFFKIILAIIILIMISLCILIGYKIYNASIKVNDNIPKNAI